MLIPLLISTFLSYVPPRVLGVPRRCRKVGALTVRTKGSDLMGGGAIGRLGRTF